ncbi:MAG: alpha/beta hydrolase [Alphaproteobacteria bacterium]|nr:alpha/beta hydrolase [Alphaproteobacteria bacterium]
MSSEQVAALKTLLRERGKPKNPTVPEMRARIAEVGERFPAPQEAEVTPVTVAGRYAEWIAAPSCLADRAVLYLHGGGYVIGSCESHRNLAYNIAAASKAKVLLLDYRLAPESPFPAAVDDAVAAYCWLLDEGFSPSGLSIAGDSAGGGLAVAALTASRYRGQPMPAAGLCLSPWVDMEGIGASMAAKEDEDPTLNHELLLWFSDRYLAGADPRAPLAAPIYADLAGLPPLLIQVGTAEVLLDESLRLAEHARTFGVNASLDIAHDMVHVWQLFEPILDEAGKAIARAGAFLRGRMR